MLKTILLTTATVLSTANAWWDEAHLITAKIAYDILLEEDPAALDAANTVLAQLKKDGSDIPALSKEKNYPFVECAPFADTIKGQGYSFQSDWHFVNNPYLDEDPNINDYTFNDFSPQNVSSVVVDIIDMLDKAPNYTKSATYITIMKYFDTEADAASFSLRLLIHYFGDAHQPCHSITRVDDEYPSGDRGCNSVPLTNVDGASNLHAVWDSLIYNQTAKTGLPMSDYTWERYNDYSAEYRSQYTLATKDYATNDPYEWANENEAAAAIVYDGVQENGTLSPAYQAQALSLSRQHVFNGGRRLANTIKYIYGSNNADLFLQ